jgi:hypothetical protein
MMPDNTTEQHDQQQQTGQVDQKARRKFLTQAGIGSLPVLMSLKSGDAWGCVPLNCTGGDGNWSGTASAVASVQKKEIKDIAPIFDSVATIKEVVRLDIGILVNNTNGYLWDHVRTLRCKKTTSSGTTYPLVYQGLKATLGELTATDIATWASRCVTHSANQQLFNNSSGTSRFTISASTPLRKPITYKDTVICATTPMKTFFPLMNKTLWDCLNSSTATDLERFVTAAFVGSLWQTDAIWTTPYASGVKSKHKPNCYPEISVLMAAYTNVINNAAARKITATEAGADMGRMFKAYTKL